MRDRVSATFRCDGLQIGGRVAPSAGETRADQRPLDVTIHGIGLFLDLGRLLGKLVATNVARDRLQNGQGGLQPMGEIAGTAAGAVE